MKRERALADFHAFFLAPHMSVLIVRRNLSRTILHTPYGMQIAELIGDVTMNDILRIILVFIGALSVLVGTIGIFVPLLPTTPFLLLGAVCFGRSSDRFYRLLLENRFFGPYIKNYRERRGITVRHKVTALSVLWLSIGNAFWLFDTALLVKIFILLVASSVSFYLFRLKTLRD
jgi:uncharacterized membrane protein YbaN (DUF454 family)